MALEKQPKSDVDLAAEGVLRGKKAEKVQEIKAVPERFDFKEINVAAEECIKELRSKEMPTIPGAPPEILEKRKDIVQGAEYGIVSIQGKLGSMAGVEGEKQKNKWENLLKGMKQKVTGPKPMSREQKLSAATAAASAAEKRYYEKRQQF